jgi:hypothetical protein
LVEKQRRRLAHYAFDATSKQFMNTLTAFIDGRKQ